MLAPEPTGVMAYALWLLSTHPEAQEKLVAEVKAHGVEKGEVAGVRAVGEYAYLHAVLKESKRFPPLRLIIS
jgi:cytochrome P450